MLGSCITWLIDRSKQPVHCPVNMADYFKLFSAKKKQHSITLLLITALDRS
jgi:hypothetical protein